MAVVGKNFTNEKKEWSKFYISSDDFMNGGGKIAKSLRASGYSVITHLCETAFMPKVRLGRKEYIGKQEINNFIKTIKR